jgi:hypothetical protein
MLSQVYHDFVQPLGLLGGAHREFQNAREFEGNLFLASLGYMHVQTGVPGESGLDKP